VVEPVTLLFLGETWQRRKARGLMLEERLEQLIEALDGAHNVLILPHNNPDPDAIASAVALRYLLAQKLGVEALVAYGGIIGRAENKALVRYLGYPLRRLAATDFQQSAPIALVDAQPGAGNVTLPPEPRIAIVIDHHPYRKATGAVGFSDVRPELGATSTILTEYLRAAGIEPSTMVATALFYGIKTDTMGLVRSTSQADALAFCYLQSQADIEALSKIEQAQVPADYFRSFAATLQAARVYDSVLVAYLGQVDYPDLGAEMADMLLRLKGIRWVICMGTYKDVLLASVRTRNQGGAGRVVQEIVGSQGVAGGHGAMAGGQVPLNGRDPERLALQLTQRGLQYLTGTPEIEGRPLLSM
jgi:nanoRNase/pAp phosphatase (c-di-AMP/oligoRNAs hydrolase)